ncbi:MAG: flagellar export protein FliJ [Thiotrichales bacterium]|nr:flagellar export protein FliJ [Thiotrichales bacterium]
MTPRSKRIKPVSRLADRAERKAALDYSRTRMQLMDLQNKLATMKTYRSEYQLQQNDTNKVISVKDLQHKQTFLVQLDEAIAILEKQISNQAQLTRQEQQKWITTWKHMNSLNKAIDNLRSKENRQKERQEQARLDEHALHPNQG